MLIDDPKDEVFTTLLIIIKGLCIIILRTFHCYSATSATKTLLMLKMFRVSISIISRAILSIPVIPIKSIQITLSD